MYLYTRQWRVTYHSFRNSFQRTYGRTAYDMSSYVMEVRYRDPSNRLSHVFICEIDRFNQIFANLPKLRARVNRIAKRVTAKWNRKYAAACKSLPLEASHLKLYIHTTLILN